MKESSRAGRTELLQTQDLNFVICSHSISSKAYDHYKINQPLICLFPKSLPVYTSIHTKTHNHAHTNMKQHFLKAEEEKRCLITLKSLDTVVIENM